MGVSMSTLFVNFRPIAIILRRLCRTPHLRVGEMDGCASQVSDSFARRSGRGAVRQTASGRQCGLHTEFWRFCCIHSSSLSLFPPLNHHTWVWDVERVNETPNDDFSMDPDTRTELDRLMRLHGLYDRARDALRQFVAVR